MQIQQDTKQNISESKNSDIREASCGRALVADIEVELVRAMIAGESELCVEKVGSYWSSSGPLDRSLVMTTVSRSPYLMAIWDGLQAGGYEPTLSWRRGGWRDISVWNVQWEYFYDISISVPESLTVRRRSICPS